MTGIVIGKFYPLHKGHLELFQNALKYCDKLIVVVFGSSACKFTLNDKRITVKYDSFAGVNQIKFESNAGISRLYAQHLKDNYEFDTIFGHELYTKYIADYIGCAYKIVNSSVNEHATEIRQDIHNKFFLLAEEIKQYFSLKICLIGTGSVYKSTLTEKLSNQYKNSISIPEYGKEFVRNELSQNINLLKFEHFDNIIKHHSILIKDALGKQPLIILDTDYLTSEFWCNKYFSKFNQELTKYRIEPDFYVLCGQDGAKYTQDFCNDYDNHKRAEEIELINFYNANTKKPIYYVDGNLRDRLKLIEQTIKLEFDKKLSSQ
jgi:HTH-type transcriptional regulator, transcriptional repressor of NAD biosynthesis genes